VPVPPMKREGKGRRREAAEAIAAGGRGKGGKQ
jgi:hypothetical protein